jgi:hypothetical protein
MLIPSILLTRNYWTDIITPLHGKTSLSISIPTSESRTCFVLLSRIKKGEVLLFESRQTCAVRSTIFLQWKDASTSRQMRSNHQMTIVRIKCNMVVVRCHLNICFTDTGSLRCYLSLFFEKQRPEDSKRTERTNRCTTFDESLHCDILAASNPMFCDRKEQEETSIGEGKLAI